MIRTALMAASFLMMQSHAANIMVDYVPPKVMKVRLTAYWIGQDDWTSSLKSSTGRRLVSGLSCAVDPDVIPYGSQVTIRKTGRTFVAVDTGTAVVNRKSEWWKPRKYRKPVVDLFFKTQREAENFLEDHGKYVEVEIRNKKENR